jgi:subtilisin family serine protease
LIPHAEFFVADIFESDSNGSPIATTIGMVRALDWLEGQNVSVANLSLSGPRDEIVERAVRRLEKRGIVLVAAAGNQGPGAPPSYPAAYKDQVIAVTALTRRRTGYRYANHGDYIDFAAPGVNVWTALPNRREGYQTGTSLAVPYVTAAIAALAPSTGGRLRHAEAIQLISAEDLGPLGPDPMFGRGLVQAPNDCGKGRVAMGASRGTITDLSALTTSTNSTFALTAFEDRD